MIVAATSQERLSITDQMVEWCDGHARAMCAGAKTKSFKHDCLQSHDVYLIGKIGELAVHLWLRSLGIKIIHNPFRRSYAYFDTKDDFIAEGYGGQYQLEVRTKARSVDIQPHYECCSDCIKPHLTYVFVNYNRVRQTTEIVGFADEELMRANVRPVLKGAGNCNFAHKANEYNIQAKTLLPPCEFTNLINGGEYTW